MPAAERYSHPSCALLGLLASSPLVLLALDLRRVRRPRRDRARIVGTDLALLLWLRWEQRLAGSLPYALDTRPMKPRP